MHMPQRMSLPTVIRNEGDIAQEPGHVGCERLAFESE